MMSAESEVAAEHPAWHDHQVVTFDGATGTHPTPMRLIDLIRMPAQQVPREKALAFIPSSFSGPRARKKEAQQSHGSYVTLNADYDGGCEADNPVEVIRRALEEFTQGGPWVAYTTFRATGENPRMRILIPLNEPVEFEVWKAGQAVLSAHLVAAGVPVDNCANRASQLMFAPNSLSGFFKRSIRNEEAKAISLRDPVFSDRMAQALERRAGAAPKERAKIGAVAAGVEIDSDGNIARAEAYLTERKGAPEGNRDNWTYKTACALIDFGISAEMCFELLAPWDLEKNVPPLGEDLVRVKCDSAWRTRSNVVGSASIEAEFAGIQPEAFERVAPIERPKLRARRLWLGDKSINTSQQWLMWNRFPKIGTAALSGPSQSGKTFLALDLAACMGAGKEWLGETGEERVGSIILSAEGIGGLPARIKGYDYAGPVVAIPVGALDTDKAKAALVKEIEEVRDEIRSKFDVRLGLVVIDTMTAAGLLAQENDNSEIGRMIKYLEEIATTFRCLCMTIHHPPKSGTGLRGGYALHAGFDVVVEVFQQGNERFVECTKNRDGEAGSWGSFVLEKIIVEPDLSGAGRDTTTQRVIYGAAKRNQKLFTFVDSSLVDAILEAVGDGRHRKNWSSDKSSIIDIIGDAAGLDTTKRVGKDTAKAYLEAMLKSGQLIEVEGRDEHRNRVLYVETPKVADATGGVSGA